MAAEPPPLAVNEIVMIAEYVLLLNVGADVGALCSAWCNKKQSQQRAKGHSFQHITLTRADDKQQANK